MLRVKSFRFWFGEVVSLVYVIKRLYEKIIIIFSFGIKFMDWFKEYWGNFIGGEVCSFEVVCFEIGCFYSKIIYY